MAKLSRNKQTIPENFTIEVPHEDGTETVIKGTISIIKQKEIRKVFKEDFVSIDKVNDAKEQANRLLAQISIYESKQVALKENDKTQTIEDIEKYERLINKLFSIKDDTEELSEILEDTNSKENIAKYKIEKGVISSDNKELLMELCETHGYSIVFDTILQSIKEGKSQEEKS